MTLSAVAQSDAGLALVELRVDGAIVQQQTIAASGVHTIDVAFPWFSSRTGWRQLSVVAYDKQGRLSEPASIQVGVQAAEDGQPGAADGSGAGEAPAAGDGPVPGANPEVPPVGPEVGQPLPELPPQPQDNAPEVTGLEIKVLNLVPNGAGVGILASATDDLGVQRMAFSWRKTGEGGNDLTQVCGGAAECKIDQVAFFTPGEYILTVQAFDTSGQASELKAEWVEVMGDADQPPAVADQGFDLDWGQPGLFDDIADRWADIDIGAGFDMDEFLDGLFGGGAQPNAAGGDQSAEGDCASITVEPRPDGNLVSLTVRCDLHTDEQGSFLYPHVSKNLVNAGNDSGIDLRIREWYDNQRSRLSSGETFTWRDDDVTCAMAYRYGVRVDVASETQAGLGVSRNLAFAAAEAVTPACVRGTIGAVNLRSEPRPGGLAVLWNIAPRGNWPNDLPAEGVAFSLLRFAPASGESLELYKENLSAAELSAGGQFSVVDDNVQCGDDYWYSLTAIAADADPHLVSPGWLLRTQTHAPILPCPAGDLGRIELRLTPYWINETFVRIRVQTELPPGFSWPQGDHLHLVIRRTLQGSVCAGQACWATMTDIPITDEVRLHGLVYDEDDARVDPGNNTYVYRLSLQQDFQEIQGGASFSATTPPAPPPPPEIVRLTASNNCPGGAARCVVVEWQAYTQPRQNGPYAQASSIAVERLVGAIDRQLFPVGLGDTRYVDLSPYVAEIRMANGQVRRVCLWSTNYRMVAFDAEGHTYGASPLVIDMPECAAPLHIVVEPH